MFKLKSIIPILLLGVSINAFGKFKPPVWELDYNDGQDQSYTDIGNIVSLGNHKVRFISKLVRLSDEEIVVVSMTELNCKTGMTDTVALVSNIPYLPEINAISFFQSSDTATMFDKICAKGEK